jgi:NitT/TauT family transport system permease protein
MNRRALQTFLLPLLGAFLVIGAWWIATDLLRVDPLILPRPTAVFAVLERGVIGGQMLADVAFTVRASLVGFLIGSFVGFMVGAAVGELAILNRFVYPVVLGIQSMPTIAIAPLLIAWLGIDSRSKIVTVAIGCFFPVFISTVAGMGAVKAELLDLYRVFSASRWRTVWELKIPSALHYVFGGLQIAIVLSLIICVVSELLASLHGLGYLIKTLGQQLDLSTMFAAIIILGVLGAIGSGAVRTLHRLVVFWETESKVKSQ